jgi:hypothetical protein
LTYGLRFGKLTCVVAPDTVFSTNQVGNLAEIVRNIEKKLVVWRKLAEAANVSTNRHLQRSNQKSVRI